MTDYSVFSGNILLDLGLNGGDQLNIYSGGTASGTFVSSGGIAIVYSGGDAAGTTVGSGGTLIALPGSIDSGTNVEPGGHDYVSSGAVILVEGGAGVTVAHGSFYGPPVSAGWAEYVLDSSTTVSATIDGFVFVYSGGIASALTVAAGGFIIVSSGGSALHTTVDNGGSLLVLPGAKVNATVNDGGEVISTGVLVMLENDGQYAELASAATLGDILLAPGDTAYVLAGGMLDGTVDASTLQVYSGGIVDGGAVFNDSAEFIHGGGIGSSFFISSGGTEFVLSGGTADDTTVCYGGTEYVYSGGSISGTELQPGGALDLSYFAYAAGGTANLNSSGDVLTVTESGITTHLDLGGSYADEFFHLAPDAGSGTLIVVDGTPCYCRGTRILTAFGEVAVETLAIGDLLVTRSGQLRPIRWIGTRAYDGDAAAGNAEILPILIKQNAIADGVPKRNLYVSPLHAFYLDGVLIPARALVNHISIEQLGAAQRVEYFHLELDRHDVILAEGAAAESFLDDNNRGMFQNACGAAPVAVKAEYCAPRLETGPIVAAVRARLALRAVINVRNTPVPLTVRLAAGLNRTLVPGGTASLRLVSEAGLAAGDIRQLGALITSLAIDDTPLDLSDGRLIGGFHPAETHGARQVRWTDGDALMLLDPHPAERWCAIEVAATMDAAA